ncbi:MAG: excinuclease ABC subunit UvrA, partial [Acidobacteriota bacterium]
MSETDDAIVVKGAKVHNLKNITVRIPLDSFSVVTGVSGSGKSSFAFDTVYAEGQRRYIASLSAYARQFLERIDRPEVEEIEGICPALAIRQKNYSRNPRSTVGTVTDPAAANASPRTRRKSSKRTERFGDLLDVLLPGLQQQGFIRLLIDGETADLSQAAEAMKKHPMGEVRVIVDRLAVRDDIRERLVDSIEVCSRESDGHIEIILLSDDSESTERMLDKEYAHIRWVRHEAGTLIKFSDTFECQLCGIRYQEPEPRLFSFNNPFGACAECQGFGNTMTLDFDLVIPDKSKSLAEGAIDPWAKPRYRPIQNRLLQFAARENIPVDVPWSEMS